MNQIPCKDCKHFDRQRKGGQRGPEDTNYAWCAAKSVYPAEGMTVPDGAQTTRDPVTKPVIVTVDSLVRECVQAVRS